MIDTNIQSCYIKCLVDQINPEWIGKCNFVNLYCNKNRNSTTTLYITDDGKTILYITNKIYVLNEGNGKPWGQKYEKYLKNMFPKELTNTMFSYSGLYFNEFKHVSSLLTLYEHIRVESYNSRIICGFLDKLTHLLKYHIGIFCLSENLLLVDKNNEEILLPSYNYVVSITHPIPEEMFTLFKNKLHPIVLKCMKNVKTTTNSSNSIANTGLYNPTKMKQICIRLIERSAVTDRVHLLSSIIYYFAIIGTMWKLQKQWSPGTKRGQKCIGICSLSKNHTNIELKKTIHDYVCIDVVNNLPINLKKTNALYTEFITRIHDLQCYLIKLN